MGKESLAEMRIDGRSDDDLLRAVLIRTICPPPQDLRGRATHGAHPAWIEGSTRSLAVKLLADVPHRVHSAAIDSGLARQDHTAYWEDTVESMP